MQYICSYGIAPRVAALLIAAVAAATPAAAGPSLVMNGKTASRDVRLINGAAYVKLADVAKALGMVVVKRGDGSYEIKKAGGTQQVGELDGKIGDVLFDGKWRFQLIDMQPAPTYKMKTPAEPSSNLYATSDWNSTERTLTAKAGYRLIVLQCRVTNGQKTKQSLWTAPSDDKLRTALADTDGASHPPMAVDYAGGPNVTPPMVPGASLTFTIVFGISESARPKDLIFTLKNNDFFEKGNDVRVSLGH